MLQQTSAAVVGPRWKRFLRRFPTLDRLAAASEEEVLAEWSGLGYYARARNLLVAARVIGSSSRFPGSARELRKLPGVGEYTAAAVASIAFSERVAAVDTNARRVLARLMAHDRALELRRFAELLVPAAASGDHNQAVMDLGATVCLPGAPRCRRCRRWPWPKERTPLRPFSRRGRDLPAAGRRRSNRAAPSSTRCSAGATGWLSFSWWSRSGTPNGRPEPGWSPKERFRPFLAEASSTRPSRSAGVTSLGLGS